MLQKGLLLHCRLTAKVGSGQLKRNNEALKKSRQNWIFARPSVPLLDQRAWAKSQLRASALFLIFETRRSIKHRLFCEFWNSWNFNERNLRPCYYGSKSPQPIVVPRSNLCGKFDAQSARRPIFSRIGYNREMSCAFRLDSQSFAMNVPIVSVPGDGEKKEAQAILLSERKNDLNLGIVGIGYAISHPPITLPNRKKIELFKTYQKCNFE